MLKPPPPTKKSQTKTAKRPDDDTDENSELHKYAAPGEHIEIPAWKRSGLVMKVENAHYGPEGGRRYLVSHNPSDEKGSWYQLEPHHFHNNDNPDHHKVVADYLDRELTKAMYAAADAAKNKTHGTQSDDYKTAARRMREMNDVKRGVREVQIKTPAKNSKS